MGKLLLLYIFRNEIVYSYKGYWILFGKKLRLMFFFPRSVTKDSKLDKLVSENVQLQ